MDSTSNTDQLPDRSLTESETSRKIAERGFKYDTNLQISPENWKEKVNEVFRQSEEVSETAFEYPSIGDFAYFSAVSYFDHKNPHEAYDFLKEVNIPNPPNIKEVPLVIPRGFTYLASATNTAVGNGYFGVAYINQEKRQIILAHRGTILSCPGAWLNNAIGVCMNECASQIPSALTFAHKVAKLAEETDFEVFYTGHSLGGWLAQISTFSHLYLNIDTATMYFQGQAPSLPVMRGCYSVVFDSPGAYEILFSLKKKLFEHLKETTQNINVERLPVEVYLFHPNIVNRVNFQVGSVCLLDIKKAGVNTNYSVGTGKSTHGINPAARLLKALGEVEAVKSKVIDYEVRKRDVSFNQWKEEGSTVPWKPNVFSDYFFNQQELEFLKDEMYRSEGAFQGINYFREVAANQLVVRENPSEKNSEFTWKLIHEDATVDCGTCIRQLFMSRVRQTVQNIKRGVLWWNSNTQSLPRHYINRRVGSYEVVQKFTDGPQSFEYERRFAKSLIEAVNITPKLLLLADPPGMGKSSALTKLEMELREKLKKSLRIVVRVNLNQITSVLKKLQSTENDPSLFKFLNTFCPYVPSLPVNLIGPMKSQEPVPVFVLLDALDEVFPDYKKVMLQVLRNLMSSAPTEVTNFLTLHTIVLASRPHLKELIEGIFNVQAASLYPLGFKEQVQFLRQEIGTDKLPYYEAVGLLCNLERSRNGLMGNPLMLSLCADILKTNGTIGHETKVVDRLELYSRFMDKKHELYVVEKLNLIQSTVPARTFKENMMEHCIKFYSILAINEITGSLHESKQIETSEAESWKVWFNNPDEDKKIIELLSYGLIVNQTTVRFKHRSFAEYFYALLLTKEDILKNLRNCLLGRMYQTESYLNIEDFVHNILVKRKHAQFHHYRTVSKLNAVILSEDESKLFMEPHRLQKMANIWLEEIDPSNDMYLSQFFEDMLFNRKEFFDDRHVYYSGIEDLDNVPMFQQGKHLEEDEFENLVGVKTCKRGVLRRFLNGKLFPLLCGDIILQSLDYTDERTIKNILKPNPDDSNNYIIDNLVIWLQSSGDSQWARLNVFQMNTERITEMSQTSAKLITAIVFRGLGDCISKFFCKREITQALNSCDDLIETVSNMDGAMRVSTIMDTYKLKGQRVRDCMIESTKKEIFHTVLREITVSWWFTQVLTKEDFRAVLAILYENIDLFRGSFGELQRAFGHRIFTSEDEELYLTKRFLNESSITSIGLCNADNEILFKLNLSPCRDISRYRDNLNALDISGCMKNEQRLRILEDKLRFRECKKSFQQSSASVVEDNVDLIAKVVHGVLKSHSKGDCGNGCKWFSEKFTCLRILPFAILYEDGCDNVMGILNILQQGKLAKLEDYEDFKCIASSYLLLVHIDSKTEYAECRVKLRYLMRNIEPQRNFKALLNLILESTEQVILDCLTQTGLQDFHAVHQALLGKTVLALIQKRGNEDFILTTVNEEGWKFVIHEIINFTWCCDLPEVLRIITDLVPEDTLKNVLDSATSDIFTYANRNMQTDKMSYWTNKITCLCALGSVIDWRLNLDEISPSSVTDEFNVQLKNISVELILMLKGKEEGEIVILAQQLKKSELLKMCLEENINYLRTKSDHSFADLHERFEYKTEMEWEILLDELYPQRVTIGNTDVNTSEGRTHIYESTLTPLISVLARRFGKKMARTTADKYTLWPKEGILSGELLHVAIEVGSLMGVKQLAWPGHIIWENGKGKTALNLVVETYPGGSEIRSYIEDKYNCAKVLQLEWI